MLSLVLGVLKQDYPPYNGMEPGETEQPRIPGTFSAGILCLADWTAGRLSEHCLMQCCAVWQSVPDVGLGVQFGMRAEQRAGAALL